MMSFFNKIAMNKQFLFLKLFFCFIVPYTNLAQETKEVLDYEAIKNEVIFNLTEKARISLKFLDSKNIKFWFAPHGRFERNNESFAVVNEAFDPNYIIKVNKSGSNYEVFTDQLRVIVNKSPFKIQIFNKYQRLILADVDLEPYKVNGSIIKTTKVIRGDEHFLGLGEKTGPLDRRGHSYIMWNSDKPCYSDSEDPLYKSIPFFMSNYNYGIFFDNTYKTHFDFGEKVQNQLSFSSPNGAFVYYFFYGSDYKDIIKSYTKLTGQPIMPPSWALGWSQSRGMLTNEDLTRDIAAEYRKRGIPCDIIYQDIGWVEGLQNFKWRDNRYADAEKMLSDLKNQGFKVIVSQDPVISQETKEQWQEANKNGFLVKDNRTGLAYNMPWPWGGNAGVVDFTNPEVADWWGSLQQKPLDDGVKGFWTDMGEPAWSNEESVDRLHMKHHVGMHDEIHNVYGLTWDKVVSEQFEKHNPNQRVFQMTRAAYAGLQRYTFGWSGDSGNGEDVNDGWENLANQIPLGLSAGLGLIPFWTTDISGYCGDITDYNKFSELYVRWLQFGVFNPLSRAHHEGNNAVEPWLFGEEAERIAKKTIEMKYQLIPYLYTYAREAYDTGLPILRALPIEFPKDEKTMEVNDQFLFGNEFLVAPVVEQDVFSRKIYLPKGRWIDYNTPSKVYKGPIDLDYKVSLETIPMFVRDGAIVPKMPVMNYIGEVKNAAMIFEIFPSEIKDSSFELYEDDGLTNNYKKDIFLKTNIGVSKKGDNYSIVVSEPQGDKVLFKKRNYVFQMHLPFKPRKVLLNNLKLKQSNMSKLEATQNTIFNQSNYLYNKDNQMLYIKTPDTKLSINIDIIK